MDSPLRDMKKIKKSIGKTWKEVEDGFFKNKNFRDYFYKSEPDSSIILVKIRIASGLTQDKLAKKMKTSQESVARAESRGCTLTYLKRAAFATGKYLEITIKDIPKYGN